MKHCGGLIFAMILAISCALPQRAAAELCREAMTTLAMRQCLSQQLAQQEAEMGGLYRRLSARLPASRREKLERLQQAWLQFRQRSAEFEASEAEGGSLAPVLYLSALVRLTEIRNKDLEALLMRRNSQ